MFDLLGVFTICLCILEIFPLYSCNGYRLLKSLPRAIKPQTASSEAHRREGLIDLPSREPDGQGQKHSRLKVSQIVVKEAAPES